MNILQLPLDSIDAGDRLRAIDEDYAQLIAASMAEQGQMTPVEVRATPSMAKPYALVSGGHRLRAAAIAGLATIDAALFEGSKREARLREIDENLVRRELSELDRATFLAQRKDIYEDLHPETKHGGDRRSDRAANLVRLVARFTTDAAERVGLSERTVRRALARHDRIAPDVRAAIAGTWLADNGAQLDALARYPQGHQRLVPGGMREHPGLRNVKEIIDLVLGDEPPAPDPDGDRFEAFLRLWNRMTPYARGRVRDYVASNSVERGARRSA